MSIRKGETIAEVQICAEIIPWQKELCISASLPALLAARIEKICTAWCREEHVVGCQLREGKVALLVPMVALGLLFLWICCGLGVSPVIPIPLDVCNAGERSRS